MRAGHVFPRRTTAASAALLSSFALLLVGGCQGLTSVENDPDPDRGVVGPDLEPASEMEPDADPQPPSDPETEDPGESDPPANPEPPDDGDPPADPDPADDDPPDDGVPIVGLARLEPSVRVPVGQPLQAWVRIDREPEQAVTGGVIFSDSATGNHWHAFVFGPGGPREQQVVSYTPEEVGEVQAHRTVTVRVNHVFDGYRAAPATMSVEVVPR